MSNDKFNIFHNAAVFRDGVGDDSEDLDTFANGRLLEPAVLDGLQETDREAVQNNRYEIFSDFESEKMCNTPIAEDDKFLSIRASRFLKKKKYMTEDMKSMRGEEKFDSIENDRQRESEEPKDSSDAKDIHGKREDNKSTYNAIKNFKSETGIGDNHRHLDDSIGMAKSKSYTMNYEKTLEHLKDNTSPADSNKEYFDEKLGSSKNNKIELVPKGAQYYLTGKEASGNFLSKEYPGETPSERKENLQLPPENNAKNVYVVESARPQIAISGQIVEQKEWANKGNYNARDGIEQIYTPNSNEKGAIAGNRYVVKKEIEDK